MAGKALKLNPKVFDQKHGTVLDSGTTYAYFPKDAFVAFKDAVRFHLLSLVLPWCLFLFVFGNSLCIIQSQASFDTY